MNDHQEWERSTRRVHLVCGLAIGSLIGLYIGWDWFSRGPWWAGALCMVLCAFGCGGLAWKYLDGFWRGLLRWFHW